jgi:hypothetical protein
MTAMFAADSGGPHIGRATPSLIVDGDIVIFDDIWAWRADHGTGVGWTENTADSGVIVNGSNVTATGHFVEHYQKTEVIWNGESGKTIFFQNEMPYDVPNHGAWMNNGVNGYPAYKVADSVKSHEAWDWAATASSIRELTSTQNEPSKCRAPAASGCTTC